LTSAFSIANSEVVNLFTALSLALSVFGLICREYAPRACPAGAALVADNDELRGVL
jgi:hypothetical protein